MIEGDEVRSSAELRRKVGENLRALRRARRLSQLELAKKNSINQVTYCAFELGNHEMGYDMLKKMAQFHKVSLNSLLGMEGEFKPVDEVLKKYEEF